MASRYDAYILSQDPQWIAFEVLKCKFCGKGYTRNRPDSWEPVDEDFCPDCEAISPL